MRHLVRDVSSRPLIAAALAAMVFAASLPAQNHKEPKRPELPAGADTNDASAYYKLGESELDKQPTDAADAFYWAVRINPGWPDALYARRVALLLGDGDRLIEYMNGRRGTLRSKDVMHIDSLQLRALSIDPFLYRKFDRELLMRYVTHSVQRSNGGESVDMAALHYDLSLMRNAGPWMQGWNAYCDGRFIEALKWYADALKHTKEKSGLHADRARIFYLVGAYDSARAEMTRAVEEMRAADAKDMVYLYDSKAVFEESIGMIEERSDHPDAAREAYARALEEDLSYAPAHERLALLALGKADTATAVTELDLAVQLCPDDGVLRVVYGTVLAKSGKFDEAVAQLTRAAELEPYYSAPQLLLALTYDTESKPDDARGAYTRYVALASRADPMLASATSRLAELGQATAAAPANH